MDKNGDKPNYKGLIMENNGNDKKILDKLSVAMEKPQYKVPIKRSNGNSTIIKGLPEGLEIKGYEAVIQDAINMLEEGNFTPFNHKLLEALPKSGLQLEAIRLYIVLVRRLAGYHRPVDKISNSQLQNYSGLSKRAVFRSLNDLHKRNMIFKIKQNGNCYYGLTSDDKWKSGVTLKLLPKKQKQSDLFEDYYTKEGVMGDTYEGDTAGTLGVSPVSPSINNIYINTKNTRAREGQGLCKITARGLTKEEVLQHAANHNCNAEGTTCPDDGPTDCMIFGRLNLIKMHKILDDVGNSNKTQINGKDAGQGNGKGNDNGLTAQSKHMNFIHWTSRS
ncbi:MAG: replication protein [Nitrospirota bacterium]